MRLNLKGSIKTIDTIDNGRTFGDTEFKRSGFGIRIALDRNRKVDEFCGTLLHELLHVWFKVAIKISRISVTDKEEHKIIEGIENVVMYFLHLNLKRRKL